MKIKIIFVISLFLLSITGCDYYDDRLVIINESPNNIYVTFSNDTILSLGENKTFIFEDNLIAANSKKNILLIGSKNAWQFFVDKSLNKQLHVFILSEDTLKKYETSTIIKMKKYERRIDIGIEDLKAKNWEIIYE
jgi:hypothetical protein